MNAQDYANSFLRQIVDLSTKLATAEAERDALARQLEAAQHNVDHPPTSSGE